VRSKHRISRPFPSYIYDRPFVPPSYRIGGQTYGLSNLHLNLSTYLVGSYSMKSCHRFPRTTTTMQPKAAPPTEQDRGRSQVWVPLPRSFPICSRWRTSLYPYGLSCCILLVLKFFVFCLFTNNRFKLSLLTTTF
jgi:hypothetical protein